MVFPVEKVSTPLASISDLAPFGRRNCMSALPKTACKSLISTGEILAYYSTFDINSCQSCLHIV